MGVSSLANLQYFYRTMINKRVVSTRQSRRPDDMPPLDSPSYDIESTNQRALANLWTQRKERNRLDRMKLLRAKHQPGQPNPQSPWHSRSQMLSPSPVSTTINDLRNERRSEELREQQISNRIRYFNEQTQRNLRKAQWARKKYSLMVEQRNHNLQMRENVKENISLIKSEKDDYARSMHDRTDTERRIRKQHIKQFQTARRSEAMPVKEMSKRNSITIHQFKQSLEEKNRMRATSVKEKEFYLTVKLGKRDERRKAMARTNHCLKILEEMQKKKQILVRNESLIGKLNHMGSGIKKASQQAQSELERLEKLLSGNRKRSLKTQKSFFTTKNCT